MQLLITQVLVLGGNTDRLSPSRFENRYPGCKCDIPSVNYQFSWHPKPDWSSYYSGSAEILDYFKDVVEKHNLSGFAKLNHKVLGAWWSDQTGSWTIKVQRNDDPSDTFYDEGHVLINATGVLKYGPQPSNPRP